MEPPLTMVYFVVVNNVEEINNGIKAENTKICGWYEVTKERRRSDENNEKKCVVILLRFFYQKWNAETLFFVALDRTGRSFVK